jgi:dephospho-CoA kinase
LYYTIIRPGALQDKPGTGKITTQNAAAKEGVPREDVANVIIEVLKKDSTIGKIIEFNSGDTAVREAVKNI